MRLESALIFVSQAVSAGLMAVTFPLAQFARFARSFGALPGPYPTGIVGIQRHYAALQGYRGKKGIYSSRRWSISGGFGRVRTTGAKVRGYRAVGINVNSDARLQRWNWITLIRDPVIPRRVSARIGILKR